MKADELHPYGTYAQANLDEESVNKLTRLQDVLGIENRAPPNKFHTTLIYSRRPCPNMMEMDGQVVPHRGTFRVLHKWPTQEGKIALVLEIECEPLSALHADLRTKYGATHDYPEYIPHITLSYDCGDWDQTVDDLKGDIGYTTLTVKATKPEYPR